jgi:diguanylate cyclase (GGDEF)-like protein
MKKRTILIVEDELLIAENLAYKLQDFGYQVVDIVSSGQAAINKVNAEHPDLILMDIAIKGDLDGIETANHITNTHNIPIIFLTAYGDNQTLERVTQSGCYGYILKPFKDQELHVTIQIALTKHQQQTVAQTSLVEVTELLSQYSAEKSSIYEDHLTKLPNQLMIRDIFVYLLSGMNNISAAKQNQANQLQSDAQQTTINKKLIAFVYLKIDRFERIINSLGNEKIELLIKFIAQRLTEHTNKFEYEGVTLRVQYSEFCILLADLEQRIIASNFAQLILDSMRQPFIIAEQAIFLTASMGISFYPFDGLEIEQLLEQAKQTMMYAQEHGGNKYKLYTSAFKVIGSVATNDFSLELEADLHHAVQHQELELYYQPQIDLKTSKIVSAEALIRWNHQKFGLILPNKIIPLAEASGLIEEIGEWVLKEACRQTEFWHQAGFNFLRVTVNLSGHQFKQSDLFHKLAQLLFESNLDSQFIGLELTEQVLVENVKTNIQRLNLIKKLGIQIALDDFGTGYSSLGYLHQFPFDVVKIDRCFIHKIEQNHKNAVITKSIIEMAHELNLKVIAEGIETQAELDFLVKHQCDEAQGYFFARPLPSSEFKKLLLSDKNYAIKSSALSIVNN